ncbi:MAG: HAD family hydrolase [Pirellulales bacterium]
MPIRGVIFDLDGTLVDSRLDFELMRREMELEGSPPLLEALAQLPPARAAHCWRILLDHEQRGAAQATLYPGVSAFLEMLHARGLRRGVVTRNGRETTLAMLSRLGLAFDPVVCREDAPTKPDPAALWKICTAWGVAPSDCVMIGDFRFDIEAARRAGTHAVLFTGGGGPSGLADHADVDLALASFADAGPFWRWIEQIDLGGGRASC